MNTATASTKQRADDHFAKHEYAEAIPLYRELQALDPASHGVARNLALALAASKQFEPAIEACHKAIQQQPADGDVRYALGYAFAGSGRYEEAIKELDGVLYLLPNHVQAKQMLTYSLLQRGKRDLETDPLAAERDLDRAHKLDPKNLDITATLLGAMVSAKQVGKAVGMYGQLDDAAKAHASIAPIVAAMEADPAFQNALKQVQVRKQAAPAPQPQRTTQTLDQIPCPNCKMQIMSYAAICPHCNFKLRDFGTFAGRDTGPDVVWQEVAYTIVAVIWTLFAGWQLYQALLIEDKDLRTFMAIIQGANLCIGLGLIFRMEAVMFIAKILCYINLLTGAYWTMVGFGLGQPLVGAFALLQLGLSGFMVYLINYIGD